MTAPVKPSELVQVTAEQLTDADNVAANHFPGHEFYCIESYLSVIAWLLLEQYAERHGLNTTPATTETNAG